MTGGELVFLCKERFTENLKRRQDFPTPESPMRRSLKR
jgi:hypothetical protein